MILLQYVVPLDDISTSHCHDVFLVFTFETYLVERTWVLLVLS